MPVKVNNSERKYSAQFCAFYLKEKITHLLPNIEHRPTQNTNLVLDENPVNLKRILEIQKHIST
jgi:hypothetical protein